MRKLTKRERVLRTMAFQDTDRTPLYDIFQNDAIIEYYAGERFSEGNGVRLTGRAVGRVLDMTRMAGGPVERPQTVRLENGFAVRQERWTSWIVERPFDDMPGLIDWVKGEVLRVRAREYGPAYREAFHAYIRERTACFAEGDPDGDPAVLMVESLPGLTEMYSVMGLERFSYLMADEPDLVEEWMDVLYEAELRRIEAIADPELIQVVLTADDLAYKTAPLFSPSWLRRVFMPGLKRLHDAWHERGAACIFHSDGCLWPVLDDLARAGIDGLNPLETLAGMNVKSVRERFPKLVLAGGIDVSQLLALGTPEEVREACREAIAATGGRGYFMGSSTEIHWDVPLENARAMFETAWETALS
ncbi:MAG: hypothetical protein IT210_22835 [Armatimonadetes bacterium]|nr:hypothetical protein [Armatimonadota bacterium]